MPKRDGQPESIPPVPPILPMVPPDLVPPALPAPPALPLVSPTLPIGPTPPAQPQPPAPEPSAPRGPNLPTPPAGMVLPQPPTSVPVPPVPPVPSTPPVPPVPSVQLPAPTPVPPAVGQSAQSGRFVVITGNKLIEGTATVSGEKVVIRQGAIDRTMPKADVLFIGQTRDDVYRYMLGKVPATDPTARLAVARWCMLNGLREQALTEAREVLKLQPTNTAAADLARSLEESLKQFPSDGSLPKPQGGRLVTEPEPDVTPEGSTFFASRAQPILANQCMECHARPDYTGEFKLVRVTGFEVGPQSTLANLRATAAQLKKDDPLNSPLLIKALSMHGGMKQPAFVSRQAGGYRVLEAWVLQAVGPVPAPMTPPSPPVFPPTQPITPIPPAIESPATAPASATPLPALPAAPAPVLPPVEVPPARVPPVLPTPPSIPPADTSTRSTPSMIPPIPSIPVIPPPPTVPTGVQPASGTQFGSGVKPPAPRSSPAGGDEFDPSRFNNKLPPQK